MGDSATKPPIILRDLKWFPRQALKMIIGMFSDFFKRKMGDPGT
jgi:hypothetical protein